MSGAMIKKINGSQQTTPPGCMRRRPRPGGQAIGRCLIIGAILLGAISSGWAAPPLLFPEKTARIALDPGHGGKEVGARGPTGLQEKDVCLEIARKLALKLESRYQVTLTRSDDYQVDLDQRAAIANQANADVLISLHTGAAFNHSARGMTIYYHADDNQRQPSGELTRPGKADDPHQWEQTQRHHQTASKLLASALKKSLDLLDPESPGCTVHGAPLAVLEGADMPAVLIELGHITHPTTETNLADPQYQQELTDAISKGIQAYLSERTGSGTQ